MYFVFVDHMEAHCLTLKVLQVIVVEQFTYICKYLHFSKTSLDEPLDVHLCSYFHEQHCVTRRDVIQT